MTAERLKYADGPDQCWLARDDAGAVEFRVIVAADVPVGITAHSPVPVTGWPARECHLLPGGACWSDVQYLPARVLHRAWLGADCDDDVIWRALQEWLAQLARAAAEDQPRMT